MRIVIVQGAFLPVPPMEGGAVEKIWFRMGKEFAAANHEVIHISKSFRDLPEEEVIAGVRYIRVRGYETPSSILKLKWLDLLYTRRAIKSIPPDADIIVTNTFWAPVLLRGRMGRKVYVDVQRVPKGQMKFYSHVGRLRGCSPAIFESIKREFPQSLHRKVSYVPNPVPFDVKDSAIEKKKNILFVGRIHPEKGLHILLKAFGELQKEITDWNLIIVGPHETKTGGGGAEYLNQLKEVSKEMKQVEWAGPVFDDNLLRRYYMESAIFCYPAQDESGDAAPVAPREAMAYGCVPVVSSLECFNDIITNNVNGLYFNQKVDDQVLELAKAFKRLITDKNFRETLAISAKEVSRIYAPAKVAQDFLSDFEKVLNEQ